MNYVDWRLSIFDPKSEIGPSDFVAKESDLIKAAGVMGTVYDFILLSGGTFHSIARFETPEGSFILRVLFDERLAPSLDVESWAAQQAIEVGFNTIVPIVTDNSKYLVPFSFQILPAIQKSIGDIHGSSLVNLHKIYLDGFGPIDPRSILSSPRGIYTTWNEYLVCCLDSHIKSCVESDAMTTKEAANTDEYIRNSRFDVDPVLLHNDLSKANIIGDTIIDWDSCISGDPIYDLASWCCFHMPMTFDKIISEYYGNRKRPIDFDRRFWIYYLRIALSRTVHRSLYDIIDNPELPAASLRIQLALEKIDKLVHMY